MRVSPLPTSNKLLAELTPAGRSRLMQLLKPAVLTVGDVLFETHTNLRYVYFSLDCLVSLFTPIEGHAPLEAAVVGNEGIVGVPLALGLRKSLVRALGGESTPSRAIVQSAGCAYRLRAKLHYSRGRITILDRLKLEKRVCECYGVVKREFERLLPEEIAL